MRCRPDLAVAGAALAAALLIGAPAQAGLLITIDKSAQKMIVALDDLPIHEWPVSTGQRGYDTPSGEYKPFRMEKDHFSEEWDNAPMPHSIFFTQQGHAIHGTTHRKAIGTPASHGCVRLEPENAAMLWKLVRQEKMANTRVVLSGETPPPPPPPPVAEGKKKTRSASADADFTGALPARAKDKKKRNVEIRYYSAQEYYRRGYYARPYSSGFGGLFR